MTTSSTRHGLGLFGAAPTRYVLGTFAVAVLALSACSSGGGTSGNPYGGGSSAPPSQSMTPSMAATGGMQADAATLTLGVATNTLGTILVDGKGMTLYVFTKDTPGTSACSGQCLVNWPALMGTPTAGMGLDASKLGTITRSDGSTQATYAGQPLYHWAKDVKPGDTMGQGLQSLWYVLDATGKPIK